MADVPHEELLTRATRAADLVLSALDTRTPPAITEGAVDYYLAGLLPNLQRAQIPPSYAPTHGYDWRGLTPMEFTDMDGWPVHLFPDGTPADTDARDTLERTILATWLLMGQTLVRSEQLTAPRPARRRITRTDPHLDPTVRYIDLRRARVEPTDHGDNQPATARAYQHRWIVRGLNRTSRRVSAIVS
jgi:hypothetical protein